ncbi:MAG TPA: hypothetical protein VE913_06720 [Longimicrobium sp.]|nr:hypothetical protein [Longimicrobium sp.]
MGAESLNREFAERSVLAGGGRSLLRLADALQMINRAAEAGVPIVRVDGFPLDPNDSRASSGVAADFSAPVADGHGCWTEAEAFIQERAEGRLGFALTLGADPINAA